MVFKLLRCLSTSFFFFVSFFFFSFFFVVVVVVCLKSIMVFLCQYVLESSRQWNELIPPMIGAVHDLV